MAKGKPFPKKMSAKPPAMKGMPKGEEAAPMMKKGGFVPFKKKGKK